MNPKYKKIYTCTPVSFRANDVFFIRDSGLFCKTLIQMGIESKSVMPLPYHEDDQKEDLIRTSMRNLKSAVWWKSLEIDGVILYSWAVPRYTAVARAIKKAGIRLVIHMDTSGNFDKLLPEQYTWWKAIMKHTKTALDNLLFRNRHLGYADVITMAPVAAKAMSQMPFLNDSITKINYPCASPISPQCAYDGTHKEDIILCIGRWDDEVKRPEYLMQALDFLYSRNKTNAIVIFYGHIPEKMRTWHSNLPPATAQRILLKGYLPNHQLREEYKKAKLVICTSRSEGTHTVSAEGLCCGCSVVVANRPAPLRVIHWYTTKNSGTISKEDTPESFAEAIIHELDEWNKGNRNPEAIAQSWQPHFHADRVIESVFS